MASDRRSVRSWSGCRRLSLSHTCHRRRELVMWAQGPRAVDAWSPSRGCRESVLRAPGVRAAGAHLSTPRRTRRRRAALVSRPVVSGRSRSVRAGSVRRGSPCRGRSLSQRPAPDAWGVAGRGEPFVSRGPARARCLAGRGRRGEVWPLPLPTMSVSGLCNRWESVPLRFDVLSVGVGPPRLNPTCSPDCWPRIFSPGPVLHMYVRVDSCKWCFER